MCGMGEKRLEGLEGCVFVCVILMKRGTRCCAHATALDNHPPLEVCICSV